MSYAKMMNWNKRHRKGTRSLYFGASLAPNERRFIPRYGGSALEWTQEEYIESVRDYHEDTLELLKKNPKQVMVDSSDKPLDRQEVIAEIEEFLATHPRPSLEEKQAIEQQRKEQRIADFNTEQQRFRSLPKYPNIIAEITAMYGEVYADIEGSISLLDKVCPYKFGVVVGQYAVYEDCSLYINVYIGDN